MKLNSEIKDEDLTSSPTCGKPTVVGSTVILGDCVAVMKGFSDNQFDLAIVDPPYGIGVESWDFTKPDRPALTERIKNGYVKYKSKGWDEKTPNAEYWKELFRVSKNQIVWGANYFTNFLPQSRCWIYWNKGLDYEMSTNFSHGELAWASFDKRLLSVKASPKSETNGGKNRIHPTQKPVYLYDWILKNFAENGQSILDTHLGSGSSRIAADKAGLDFTGIEIDKEYFDLSEKRFKQYKSQLRIEGW